MKFNFRTFLMALFILCLGATDKVWAVGNNLTMTSATYDTSSPKFGTAALNGGYGVGSVVNFSATAFAVETWIKTSSASGTQVAVDISSNIYIGENNSGYAYAGIGNGVGITGTVLINDGAWHHLALSCGASSCNLYVDGTNVGTSSASNVLIGTNQFSVRTYIYNSAPNNNFSGEIDEVAVWSTNKYTANFTPPSSAYTGSEGETVLYHLDSNGTDSSAYAAATTYSISGPVNGTQGQPSQVFTIQDNGTLSSAVVVTLSDGAQGGTFSPSTVTLAANGSGLSSGTFTYTASITGNVSISSTNNGGLTNPPSTTYTSVAILSPNNSAFTYSPGNWLVGSSTAETVNPGAYMTFQFAGSNPPQFNFNISNDTTPLPTIYIQIDDQAPQQFTVAAAVSPTIPSTTNTYPRHTLKMSFRSNGGVSSNNWTGTRQMSLVLTGISEPNAVYALAPAPYTAIAFGDSITQGYKTLYTFSGYVNTQLQQYSDATINAPSLMAPMLGVEMGTVGFGGQWIGTCTAGASCASGSSGDQLGDAGVPPMYQTYNLLWAGQTRTWPSNLAFVLVNGGTNDGGKGGTCATVSAGVVAMGNGLLSVVPSKTIIFFQDIWDISSQPLSGCIKAGVTTINNPRVKFIPSTGIENVSLESDGVHPLGVLNHIYAGYLSPLIQGSLNLTSPTFHGGFH